METKRVAVWVMAAALMVGCGVGGETLSSPSSPASGEPEVKTSGSRYGLSTVLGNGNHVIFFNSKGSTSAKLQTALAGGKLDENWFIIELPGNLMPSDDDNLVHDLQSKSGITLTMRHMHMIYDKQHWQTYIYASASPGVDGYLQISGVNVVANTKKMTLNGTLLGAGFQFHYKGPLDIAGAIVPSEMNIGKGFLFTPQ
jgi:hypothetical protein